MILESIFVENFKSFSGKHEFNFLCRPPGLHFVTGDNQAEPELGPNGAGKSTIFADALYWILYGKSPRGLKASQVHSWGSDGGPTKGILKFGHHGTSVTLTRTWNPNSLLLQIDDLSPPETVTQKDIEEFLGITEEACKNSIIISQFGSMFMDLSPSQKLALMSEILDLEKWETLSKRASTKESELKEELIDIDKNIHSNRALRVSIKNEIVSLKDLESGFEEERAEKVELKKIDIKEASEKLTDNDLNIKALKQKEDTISFLLKKLGKELKYTEKAFQPISDETRELEYSLNQINIDVEYLKRDKKKFESVGEACPTCLQQVSKEHLLKTSLSFDDEIKKKAEAAEELNKLLTKKEKQFKKFNSKIEQIENEIQSAEKDLYKTSSDVYFEQKSKKLNEKNKLNIEIELSELESSENPYSVQISSNKKHLNKIECKLKSLQTRKEDTEKQLRASSYWKKGFKEIRLFLIEEAVYMLNIEVNNSLVELGMMDWKITFDMEKENKSGSIAKGFHVFIDPPVDLGQSPVPWESWSGGESQRLRIAATMGLANLIYNYTDIDCDVEVWDEPSAHLSEQGITDMITVLNERAENLQKKVFLIDHRSIDVGLFKSRINVVKTLDGSRIEF